jgi:prevent-host-death family protein
MARTVRKSGVKEVPLSEIKDDLSRYLREAETQEIIITRHGKPAGVLIGFESEEDWFDYRLEHDPRFLRRIEQARDSLRAGGGIRLEDDRNGVGGAIVGAVAASLLRMKIVGGNFRQEPAGRAMLRVCDPI